MKNLLFILAMLLIPQTVLALDGNPAEYQVAGQTFEGYYVSPAADAPLVFLVHDWDGLTDYEIKRAGMLADLGYAVFAVDLFGKGIRPESTDARRKLTGELYADRQAMRARLMGGLNKAAELGANLSNTVAMGYCFGGTAVLELARSGAALKAFVPFHGGLATPKGQDYTAAKGFILVFHGTADQSVPMSQFAGLAEELESAGVPHEMTTYSGAPHAFTVFGSDRYRKSADEKSWARFTEFLKQTLK
ncbi:dienelactone hydrolase family protein [Pseudodesulfovibrio thermohalotolerans]|uniref:dienelactone hydrolase family protein n=1 Tax=Pseudodesulfovibrio thermohalotolerans TaxID=2880651 RepID=UPI002441869F|nr:dienelactone hydrolase family protein [Pseudodesulfovibrio thermohalotolerans]WFS61996.1 dienelactone hydrolase family protein [Pseudodesulfovibrio thermohalotolerans]